MKALFLVDSPHEQYLPMETIQYRDENDVLCGGYWINPLTEAPNPNTVMVVVDSSDEGLDLLAQDDTHMLYIDEVLDETPIA